MKKFVFAAFLILFTTQAFALRHAPESLDVLKSDETFDYPDYYKVHEDSAASEIDLLNLDHVQQKFPKPDVPYNRDHQFGGWLRDKTDQSCLNTRGKVLVRDSESSVSYNASGCTVASGDWDDPYSGKHYTQASDIQIDHFVPLKNAYMTGAFEWDYAKRCLYANYLGIGFHLLAVQGHENMKKSDSAPDGYVPPNTNYTCQYLKQWLEIKLIWSLRMTPREVSAVQNIAQQNHCVDFSMKSADLSEQRRFMADHADLCGQHTLEKF